MMKVAFVRGVVVVMAVVATALIGCNSSGGGGGDRAKTYPVSGTVTYNGRPVEGAAVLFVPTDKTGEAAIAMTDASGKYSLKSPGGRDGAVPGSYNVKISKSETQSSGGQAAAAPDSDDMGYPDDYNPDAPENAASTSKSMNLLPAKYNNPTTSGLSASVSASGANTFDFTLAD